MAAYEVELVEVQAQATAVVRAHVTLPEIAAIIGAAFGEVLETLAGQGLSPAGPPFARFDVAGDGFDMEAGFPASGAVAPAGRVVASELPAGPTAQALYRGDYAGVPAAYDAVAEWAAANGYLPGGAPWESYLDGPEAAEPRTLVRLPLTRP